METGFPNQLLCVIAVRTIIALHYILSLEASIIVLGLY